MRDLTMAERLKELYYRCQFTQLIDMASKLQGPERTAEVSLLVANAAMERSHVETARMALDEAAAASDASESLRLHAMARIAYMTDGTAEAREMWTELYARCKDPESRFKALLGIANTFYDERDWDQIPSLIKDLKKLVSEDRVDDEICLLHLEANFCLASGRDLRRAGVCFQEALALAGRRAWTYWAIRSLYGLAKVTKARQATAELKWTLKVLQSFLDSKEAIYLAHMIQTTFADELSTDDHVQFDSENLRLVVQDRWISFYDRPKLYQFLELLYKSQRFVTKQQIAEALWPREPYQKGTHDPRIFDIAKRVRGILHENRLDALCLKSGRLGYRLVLAA